MGDGTTDGPTEAGGEAPADTPVDGPTQVLCQTLVDAPTPALKQASTDGPTTVLRKVPAVQSADQSAEPQAKQPVGAPDDDAKAPEERAAKPSDDAAKAPQDRAGDTPPDEATTVTVEDPAATPADVPAASADVAAADAAAGPSAEAPAQTVAPTPTAAEGDSAAPRARPEPHAEVVPDPPARPDPARPGPIRPEPVRPESVRALPLRIDPTRIDPTRIDPTRIDPTRIDPTRIEPVGGAGRRRDLRRVLLVALVAVFGLGGLLTALALHGQVPDVPAIIAPSPPKVALAYQPGAEPVGPTAPVIVVATDGELREVALTAPGSPPVKGQLSADRRTWTVAEPLAYGKTYTWTGVAADVDNKTVPLAGTVTTVKPTRLARGTINIGDGRVVGIAAPIEVQFTGHITDRAGAERALQVETSVPTDGSWAWFQDEGGGSRVHWRPKQYWQPGTTVTVTAALFGVNYGGGAWGATNITSTFSIGRSQVVKADVNSHQMIVTRNGAQVFNFPASYGLGSDPDRNTHSGIHVVSEKFTDKRMVNPKYGYDVMEKWAVRVSNNGEFIHANQLTVGVQGSSNVTHGCVNLSLDNAKEYYDSAMYGDPVEVTGSAIPLSAKDGDIWDWTLSWDQWQKLSALPAS